MNIILRSTYNNFSSISGHLAVKHGMTTRDYERRFGLGDYEVEVPADDVVAEIVLMSEPGFPRMKTRQLCQLQEVRAQDEEAAGHARRVQWLRVPLARPSRGGRGRVADGPERGGRQSAAMWRAC